MRWLVVVAVLSTGCDDIFDLAPVSSVPADAPAETGCFGKSGPGNAGLFSLCLESAPRTEWVPPSVELRTDASPSQCDLVVTQVGGPSLCVIAARNITLGGTLLARGTLPLVLIATDTFTLLPSGWISVDSHRNEQTSGAGANDATCVTAGGGTSPNNDGAGGGGGAGGSFATMGASGGSGTLNQSGGTPRSLVPTLVAVRGGCAGGGGGVYPNSTAGGGSSGGAIYIIGGASVNIAGSITASGAAGAGGVLGASPGGGGGGGAGGLIALDARRITLAATAKLVANGGGGGGGAQGGAPGTEGAPGEEADLAKGSPFAANGGAGAGAGGSGGRGADKNDAAANGSSGNTISFGAGGGGGGGGAGFIELYGGVVDDQGAATSPLALRAVLLR